MYDQIAHYYDLSHAELTADLPLLLQMAQAANGAILELGCGTGRILLPLAQAGYQVTGLDNSAAMLARLRHKLVTEPQTVQERITIFPGDMTNFDMGNGRFALTIIPYNTLLHLQPRQVRQTLVCVSQHLADNGRLLIDLANPFAIAQTPNDRMVTLERTFTDPATGHIVAQFASNWLDDDKQRLHITWLYDASPANGGTIQRTIAQFDYHYLFPHQLEMLLRETGFQLQEIWGDYNQCPFDEDSPRLILLSGKE
jgi:SAM-dependent methyltransferase